MATQQQEQREQDPRAPARRAPYEAPRILSKRRVERATLVTGEGGPGGGVGGE